MVTCTKIGRGGLGNQMFKYAALRFLSLSKHYIIKIPHSPSLRLNIFPRLKYKYFLRKDSKKIVFIYDQPGFHFDPNFLNIPDNTDIVGHFQSEKYFYRYRNRIRNEFDFPADVKKMATDLIKKNTPKIGEIVAVHVRRGDYIRKTKRHPTLPKNYYLKAMKHFPSDTRFLFFSDDIEWCKKNMVGFNISYSKGKNDFLDLCAMSMCNHNIIANSSYSWWGAWLNRNTNKIVIAPSKWFGPEFSNLNTKDLIPTGWKTI